MQAENPGRQDAENHKRADYILERGMWKASCRACRWTVESPDRQRAAVMFRAHHREMLKAPKQPAIVELRPVERSAVPAVCSAPLGDEGITA